MTSSDVELEPVAGLVDVDDEPLIERIVRRVAAATNRTEFDLDPLGRTLDVEALETLAASAATNRLAFEYEGYEVEIDGVGVVKVEKDANEVG